MSEGESKYLIRNEIEDSIKLESSSLPPGETEKVKFSAKQIADIINKTYGKFIPAETLDNNKALAERVIVTGDMATFAYEWEPEVRKSNTPLDTVIGASFQEGGVVTIIDPKVAWKGLSTKNKVLYIEEAGNEENAKQQYEREFLRRTLTHELLHQYVNWDEEQEFLECGVGYYEGQILRLLQVPHYTSEQREKMNDLYASLRNRYGEEVDRMFFGTATNPTWKAEILTEVARHKEELFPEGQGL
jgi:hypothetical protein